MSSDARPDAEEEAELRGLLRVRKTPPIPKQPNLWLGRHIVMTQRDVDAFVRVLRSRYPSMVFLENRYYHGGGEGYCLVDRPTGSWTRGVVPDDEWDGEAYCALDGEEQKSARRPQTEFEFSAGSGPRVFERKGNEAFETLNRGELRGTYLRNDKETLRFIRSIMWLSTKITTNKLKSVDVATGKVYSPRTNGSYCGYDALRWCLESPNRVLNEGYRPTDDWVMPKSPWYDQ